MEWIIVYGVQCCQRYTPKPTNIAELKNGFIEQEFIDNALSFRNRL